MVDSIHPEEVVTDAAYVLFYKLRGFEENMSTTSEGALDFT